jgi:hypothetical protein
MMACAFLYLYAETECSVYNVELQGRLFQRPPEPASQWLCGFWDVGE